MRFNVTVDKKTEAVIDRKRCVNCGECRDICPTGAVQELQKTVVCMKGSSTAGFFPDAKKQSVEMACSSGCPLGIVPQAIASYVEKGELASAAEHIWARNPMPGVCASVCEHLCKDTCKRSLIGDAPLNMKGLEGYVLDNTETKPLKYIRKYHERIAVIGSGPAGLSAAYHMAMAGYGVTIFEKDRLPGGALRWGIPANRLSKDLVKEEIDRIVNAGIEVRCGWHIGEDHSLEELWAEGFSAIIIAAGESYGIMPELPGSDGIGVYDGVKIMRQITGGEDEGAQIGESIVVVGGGGFAADLARTLKRMDKDVLCVVEERREDLQIAAEIAERLDEEGIDLKTAATVGQIITEDGKVKAVELVKIDHIEDERGVLQPHIIKGSGLNFFCDTVVFASGQKSAVEGICNAETYPNGKIKIDENYKTNKEMIFACGDVTGRTSSVVEALAAGKEVAAKVDAALSGAAEPEKEHVIYSAPDGHALHIENIRMSIPQFEEKIIEPVRDDEDPFAEDSLTGENRTEQNQDAAEDILAMLRSAGIEEEMPVFEFEPEAKKAAVIGGGIAGITAAISLARKGICPVIFEKMPALGGSYRWLASEKRIDRDVLIRELDKVEAAGIEVVYGVAAGIKPNIEDIFSMGFDAILFAVGEYGGNRHEIEGTEHVGVFDMVSLAGALADDQIIPDLGKKILVAGGDGLTFDVARRLREDCEEVTVLAPWSRGVLQTVTGAADVAVDEGVNLVTGVEVVAVEQKDGRAYNAVCLVKEKDYTINVPCDTLILGGGGPDTKTIAIRNLELDMEENGHISVDHRLEASIPGVFSIGNMDMSAADAGRAGAAAVENKLTGNDTYIGINAGEKGKLPSDHEMIEGGRPVQVKGFEEGRKIFSCRQAASEASRCMSCGYQALDTELCMGCGICARVCPVNAISMKPVGEGREGNKEVQPWQ